MSEFLEFMTVAKPLLTVMYEAWAAARARGEDHAATMRAIKDAMTMASDLEMQRELGGG